VNEVKDADRLLNTKSNHSIILAGTAPILLSSEGIFYRIKVANLYVLCPMYYMQSKLGVSVLLAVPVVLVPDVLVPDVLVPDVGGFAGAAGGAAGEGAAGGFAGAAGEGFTGAGSDEGHAGGGASVPSANIVH
jgi:hypothetical protein